MTALGALAGIGGESRTRWLPTLRAHADQDLRAEAPVQARVARAATATWVKAHRPSRLRAGSGGRHGVTASPTWPPSRRRSSPIPARAPPRHRRRPAPSAHLARGHSAPATSSNPPTSTPPTNGSGRGNVGHPSKPTSRGFIPAHQDPARPLITSAPIAVIQTRRLLTRTRTHTGCRATVE